MEDQSLVKLDAVRMALAQAATVQEIKNVLDVAKAYEVYVQQQKLGEEIKQQVSEYIRTAKFKLGEMIIADKAAGRITKTNTLHRDHVPDGNMMTYTLAEAGISRKLSSECQRLVRGNGQQKKKPVLKPRLAEAQIEALYDQGVKLSEIAEQTGVRPRVIDSTIREIKIRRQEREAAAEPQISSDTLSLSAARKLELAIKQHIKKIDSQYYARIEAAVQRYLSIESERRQAEQSLAKRLIEARRGVMNKATYKKILVCLHPDWVTDPKQKARYEEAFIAFRKLEKLLLAEADSPTQFAAIPKTPAQWEEMKRKETEARRARRQANTDRAVQKS